MSPVVLVLIADSLFCTKSRGVSRLVSVLNTVHFFLEGLHPLCVWGQTDCGDSRSEGAGVGFEEHGIRSAAKGIEPEIPDPLHQSIPQQTGMGAVAAVTFLLDILQENGALFSSLFFSGDVFCDQTSGGGRLPGVH